MAVHFGGFNCTSQTDCYGFEKPEDLDEKEYEEYLSQYLPVLARRTKRWDTLIQEKSSEKFLENQGYFHDKKLKRFIRKGVPASLRPKVWVTVSGITEKMKDFPDELKQLCTKQLPEETESAIQLDLGRTFPDNQYFQSVGGYAAKNQLATILHGLSVKHPDVGYCQGLNYLAGMLLIVTKDVNAAFWMMDKMLFELDGYYCTEMKGLKRDVMVLKELLRLRAPEITAVFQKFDFDLLLVTSKWFLCWYLETLPIETVLRIWDCLFYEGPKILFRVALTLIIINKQKIVNCTSFSGIVDLFKVISTDKKALHCHHFIQSIFEIPGTLSNETIKELRHRFGPIV